MEEVSDVVNVQKYMRWLGAGEGGRGWGKGREGTMLGRGGVARALCCMSG